MPLGNAQAQRQIKLADALAFAGGLQSIAKAWASGFHGVIESQRSTLSITSNVIALMQNAIDTVGALKGNCVKKPPLIVALIALGAITAAALWKDGFVGILGTVTYSYGSIQIFADLVMALALIMVWMWRDAKNTGRIFGPGLSSRSSPAPWVSCCISLRRRRSRESNDQ
jgi:hypothetical protein